VLRLEDLSTRTTTSTSTQATITSLSIVVITSSLVESSSTLELDYGTRAPPWCSQSKNATGTGHAGTGRYK
jgi:hypothetical protein